MGVAVEQEVCPLLPGCIASPQQAALDERAQQEGTSRPINIKDYEILQRHLASAFGVPVKFSCDKSGKGKITFPFADEAQLERIISIFDSLKNA